MYSVEEGVRAWLRLVLLAVALLLPACGLCKEQQSCIPSIVVGERYEVELVRHFDFLEDEHDPREFPLVPYDGYRFDERSCEAFDLDIGDVLSFEAVQAIEAASGDEACGGCLSVRVQMEQPEFAAIVDLAPTGEERGLVWPRQAFQSFRAEFADGCVGTYWISLRPVKPDFIEASTDPVPTDYVFQRTFAPETGACGVPIEPPLQCWDNWFVRVRNADGTDVSVDIAMGDGGV